MRTVAPSVRKSSCNFRGEDTVMISVMSCVSGVSLCVSTCAVIPRYTTHGAAGTAMALGDAEACAEGTAWALMGFIVSVLYWSSLNVLMAVMGFWI